MDTIKSKLFFTLNQMDEAQASEEEKVEIKNTVKSFLVYIVELELSGLRNDATDRKLELIDEYLAELTNQYGFSFENPDK